MSRKPKPVAEETPAPDAAGDDAPEAEEAAPEAEDAAPDAEDAAVEPAADADAPEQSDVEAADPETRIAELNDKLLRALAETENVRRRAERDKHDASKYAVANIARDMLAVADNLMRALTAVDADARKADPALDQLMVGVEMTRNELVNVFERHEIKPVEALGQKFDHNLHEAMFEVENPEIAAGTVVQVVETGYTVHDRLLRPAKVGVAKGGPKGAPDAGAAAAEAQPDGAEKPAKDGQTAYETKGRDPGAQLDEEL